MSTSRGNTRTITVSLPIDLSQQAEQLAHAESRTMSELLVKPSGRIGHLPSAGVW